MIGVTYHTHLCHEPGIELGLISKTISALLLPL